MDIKLGSFLTERQNKLSENIDQVSTSEMLKIMNLEDQKVALAVEKEIPMITKVVDATVDSFHEGGRLVYIGAGTSGRLGILDASECPPTFGTPKEQVMGLIAGGEKAILSAVENAEDEKDRGRKDLEKIFFSQKDVLVGIAASGRTPYVIGAMEYAKSFGAKVASICCNPEGKMNEIADYPICAVVGPEVITGSSRLKAGTAQKLILNMISTGSMIRSGKVYGNLMVDVEPTNSKLIERQKRIVMSATNCSYEEAKDMLNLCEDNCKLAIVKILTGLDLLEVKALLKQQKGFIRKSLESFKKT